MRPSIVAALINALAFVGMVSGQTAVPDAAKPPAGPKAPGLTFLYTLNITGGTPVDIGVGPRGQRLVIPIASGTIAGPRFKGIIKLSDVAVLWILTTSRIIRQGPSTRRRLAHDQQWNLLA
jgi:hypothetical protein